MLTFNSAAIKVLAVALGRYLENLPGECPETNDPDPDG